MILDNNNYDNSSLFTFDVFKQLCSSNGIQFILTTPYLNRPNGSIQKESNIFKTKFVQFKNKYLSHENHITYFLDDF